MHASKSKTNTMAKVEGTQVELGAWSVPSSGTAYHFQTISPEAATRFQRSFDEVAKASTVSELRKVYLVNPAQDTLNESLD